MTNHGTQNRTQNLSQSQNHKTLTVYYDGLCILCSREIEHYKKQLGSDQIQFIDITADSFSPEKEGVNPFLVHKIMHAKKADGTLVTRVDAFVEIWKLLPKYHWMIKWTKNKVVRKSMDIGYEVFAKIRPYLPKRKKNCEDSPYCEIKK